MIDSQTDEILNSIPPRISDLVEKWAKRSPGHPALVEATGMWTYGQLDMAIGEAQLRLTASGVRPGDRVMLVGENCRAFVAILMAIARLDAWAVLVNARLTAREVDQIRDHCGARLLIYTTSVSPLATKHAHRHGAAIADAGSLGQVGWGVTNESVAPEPTHKNSGDQVAVLIYTSGTTGLPKGVMLTHRNLMFISAVSAEIRALSPDDRLYGLLPMSHAVGLSVVLLGGLLSGATLYLAARFDPKEALETFERNRLTIVLGVPGMFNLLAEYAKSKAIDRLNLPSLRVISSSGAPLDPALQSKLEELFGLVLHNGYGITECSPTIAQPRLDEPRVEKSVGRPLPGLEIRIVGSDQKAVASGEVGELWVRGPTIMKGYYRAPDDTATAINEEGWFNSRDLVRLQDGHLFIVGRTKELIVHAGFNVYPAEVEAALNSHPDIVRSAVVGQQVKGDEEVVAFIELSPGSRATIADLSKHAARQLSSYKQPSRIVVVSSMPLTPTGKIAKGELLKTTDITIRRA